MDSNGQSDHKDIFNFWQNNENFNLIINIDILDIVNTDLKLFYFISSF